MRLDPDSSQLRRNVAAQSQKDSARHAEAVVGLTASWMSWALALVNMPGPR